ncbi:MAG: hypothetical protein WA977_10565 [Halobacteriota archaeon]
MRSWSSGANSGAWALDANPASHPAAHHAAFSAMHLQAAIDFAEAADAELWGVGRNGIPCVLFMLIYPSSIERCFAWEKSKSFYISVFNRITQASFKV